MELRKESGKLPGRCSCFPWARGEQPRPHGKDCSSPEQLCKAAAGSDGLRLPGASRSAASTLIRALSGPGLCWEGEGNLGKQGKVHRSSAAAGACPAAPGCLLGREHFHRSLSLKTRKRDALGMVNNSSAPVFDAFLSAERIPFPPFSVCFSAALPRAKSPQDP